MNCVDMSHHQCRSRPPCCQVDPTEPTWHRALWRHWRFQMPVEEAWVGVIMLLTLGRPSTFWPEALLDDH